MIKGYYGWDPSVMLPIILTTTGVFLLIGLGGLIYMMWNEERRVDKIAAEWLEDDNQ